ncbi:uncharacterized protein LOC124366309 isoform X2 [Homalodisca vitripennis]|uniref:uncharacterized protein LOC124366309 isoform X2 n=1 Tax=Homalodisca vitripennis TaxID=197043 RepID=UPI001EECAA05|nr:uncharacterized protein LOC124366309 isoform X2 [Homalodisca vitripennis]KAG8292097.1 hypothetical protein J6590_047996 [Homalodisca vitripennis]
MDRLNSRIRIMWLAGVILLLGSLTWVDSRVQRKPLSKADVFRDMAITYIDELWINVTDNSEWSLNAQAEYGVDSAVLLAFKTLCDKLDRFVPARIPETMAENIWNYARIQVELAGIEGLYGNFRKFQQEPAYKHKMFTRAWLDLAETVLQDSDTLPSIPSALVSCHSLVMGSEQGNEQLYVLIGKEGENSLCHVQQSPHQIIYNLYNSLQMTQLKGYAMMQFSWMLLRVYGKGNFTLESELMRERYLERMAEQAISLKEALSNADAAYWRCDPKHHVEGETYAQLTRLLQGYIQNEVDLNSQQTCRENCGYYQVTKQHGCYENNFCARQRGCNGDIVECQYIDSDMWVCQADPTLSRRRYDWIEFENGRVLGNKRSCHRTSKVDSWWRWLFWHCSYCFCICDDATNSDRYFSLRNVLSSTDSNKVITGVRFVKMHGVVHIQIQEGILQRYGHIDETSISWQPVDNFRTRNAIEDKDYMKMTYYKRAIDLDDLKAPPEHVITGIKFRRVGGHLNLEIRATPINFTSGELIEPGRKDLWISNDNTDGAPIKPRTRLKLDSPDNPLNSLSPSKIDSENDQYLQFTYSDIDLDAAQTTVPYLDTQMVSPQPPVPLSGIGVYHKGVRWFGGFVGLKVFTYNYGDHIEDSFTELNGIDSVN